MFEISALAMGALQQSSDDQFVTELLSFLQQRFDPSIEREFVLKSIERGRVAGISSEQDLAMLASILWAAHVRTQDGQSWIDEILSATKTAGPDKVERLKRASRTRFRS